MPTITAIELPYLIRHAMLHFVKSETPHLAIDLLTHLTSSRATG